MKRTVAISGTVLIATLLLIVFGTGCKGARSSWTAAEKELVNCSPDTKMRLWVVDNLDDSLFLRKVCRPLVEADLQDSVFQVLKQRMLLTVTDPDNEGVGIAAPQVGISRQMVAVQRFDKAGEPFEFYVNPHFLYLSEEKTDGWEGCLSIPGKRGQVERSTSVVVEYNDPVDFSLRLDTVSGFTAIIFQHEIDHLSGVLYTDKQKK